MHILILGADGYLGWPTAMRFSALGHKVTAVDNYFRRDACEELDATLLYPVPSLDDRARIWQEKTGKEIKVVIGDLAEPEFMRSLFKKDLSYDWAGDPIYTGLPNAIIHYAEQPSAPYSLINHTYADITVINNLRVTNNLMFAVKDYCPEAHIIKLGTMGEYGTPNIDIEEGWLEVEHKGRQETFLYPRQASSLYHTTKIMDTDLLWFGVRTWGLRVTDLMQGPVYGLETEETLLDPRLKTIFNYDEIFGTLVNRFVAQAVVGYPLTVYGKGGQTRGYLDLRDTLQCVCAAMDNPPQAGRLNIFNQIMETFSVNEIAEIVRRVGNTRGHDVEVQQLPNPRREAESHYYNPTYQGLVELGVKPHYLTDESMDALFQLVEKHKDSIRKEIIFRGVKW